MRSRRTTCLAVVVVGLTLALASCSDDVFSRDDAVARLRDAGMPPGEAECVVDGVIDRLDLDVLNEERDPTPTERAALEDLRAECAPTPD